MALKDNNERLNANVSDLSQSAFDIIQIPLEDNSFFEAGSGWPAFTLISGVQVRGCDSTKRAFTEIHRGRQQT